MEYSLDSNLKDFEMYVSILIQIDREKKQSMKLLPAILVLDPLSAIRLESETLLSKERDLNVIKLKHEIIARLLEAYGEELKMKVKSNKK